MTTQYTVDRRPLYWMNWAARTATEANPRGYVTRWGGSSVEQAQFLYDELRRGERYGASMERKSGGFVPGSMYFPISAARRDLIADAVNARAAELDRFEFWIFLGAVFSDDPTVLTPVYPMATPDPENPKTLGPFLATVMPWVERMPVAGLIVDNSTRYEHIAPYVRMSAYCRERLGGLRLMWEAIPRRNDGTLETQLLRIMPAFCLSTFTAAFDSDRTWTVPQDVEVHVANTAHDPMNEAAVASYTQRGFIVGSAQAQFDGLVVAAA